MQTDRDLGLGRLGILYLIIGLAAVVLTVRLYQIQIGEGQRYRTLADLNRLRLVEVAAPRGVIYAAGGEILAQNRPSFTVVVVPADLPKDAQGLPDEVRETAVLNRLMDLLGEAQPAPTASPQPPAGSATPAVAEGTVQPSPTATPTVTLALDAKLPERQPVVMSRAAIEQAIADGRQGGAYRGITVARYIPDSVAFKIAENGIDLPGVEITPIPVRDYPTTALTSHIVGYMGPIPEDELESYQALGYHQNNWVGLMGLESSFEGELHGKAGQHTIEVDVNGHHIRTVGPSDAPEPGYNVVLSLDLELQRVATQVLQDTLTEITSKSRGKQRVTQGVVVALDPRTGAVLALVSLPSYDNNWFAKGITTAAWQALTSHPDFPLINLATSGQYPPGSTFKLIPASAGLQEGVITPDTRLTDDHGIMWLPNKYFPWDRKQDQPFVCWTHKLGYGHGPITVRLAVAQSCDIFFYKLGGGFNEFPGLGSETVGYYAREFGLDTPTGIELPGESGGLVPDPKWKRLMYQQAWVTGDTYNMSIGQGDVLATPLQMANMTAAVANRGSLYRPRLADRLTDADGKLVRQIEPDLIRTVPVDPAYLDIVREGMYGAVNWPQGTAPNARVAGVAVAGKTGTAEFYKDDNKDGQPDKDEKGNMPTHAWFTAFAPYADPEIVVTVFVANGGEGSANAVPIAQKVLAAYFAAQTGG